MWKQIFKKYHLFIYGLFFISLLFYLAFTKIGGDGDFWWLMALGRHFWETGQLTNYDMLSHTFPNGFFWNHSRLFDVIVYGLFNWGSYLLLDIFRFFLFGATYFFLYKTISIKKHQVLVTGISLALTLWFLADRLLYRPELFSVLLSAILLFLVFKDKQKAGKLIWLVPVVQLVWANSHAGFVYGLAIIGMFFGAELVRSLLRHRDNTLEIVKDKRLIKLFFVFILSTLAIFVTSYGWKVVPLIHKSLSPHEAVAGIGEWGAYSWQYLFNFLNPLSYLFWFAILVLIFKIRQISKNNFFIKLQDYPWEEIFLIILYLYSALKHGRFVYSLSIILAIIVTRNVYYLLKEKYFDFLKLKIFLHLVLIFVLLLVGYKFVQNPFGLDSKDNRYPKNVTDFILEQKLPGKMFNDYLDGGYFSFWLYPDYQVSIDGRTPNLYTNDFFWRYQNLSSENIREKMLNDYEINFIVWPRSNGLNKTLWQDENWQQIYFDNLSVVYLRKIESNQTWLDKYGYSFFASFYDENSLKEVCSESNLKEAPDLKSNLIKELEQAISLHDDIELYYRNLALIYQTCQFQHQDLEKIKTNFEQALSLSPGDKHLAYQLGFAYLQTKDNERAERYFKQAGDTQGTYLVGLGTAQYNLGQYKQALKTMLKARNMSGELDNKYYQTLARIYYQLDQNQRAIEFFHRYLDLTQDFSAETYVDLAWAYFDNHDLASAKIYLEQAKTLDKNYADIADLDKVIGD